MCPTITGRHLSIMPEPNWTYDRRLHFLTSKTLQFFFKKQGPTGDRHVARGSTANVLKKYKTVHSNKKKQLLFNNSKICYSHLYMSFSTFSHKRTKLLSFRFSIQFFYFSHFRMIIRGGSYLSGIKRSFSSTQSLNRKFFSNERKTVSLPDHLIEHDTISAPEWKK